MDTRENLKNQVEQNDGMRIVGYCPYWRMEKIFEFELEKLTHLVYVFVLPNKNATLQPIPNPALLKKVVQTAHEKGVKVLLGCGGWSSGDGFLPLEIVFKEATSTESRTNTLVKNLIDLVTEYEFDGIEIAWLHPRFKDITQTQYENFIQKLHQALKPSGLLLTTSILGGVNAGGNPVYDAAAHTENSWNYVDWVSVIAYDGGDGERHSPYELLVNSCEYWRDKRGIPADKIVGSIPFYGRPTWLAYYEILEFDPNADQKDDTMIQGKKVFYNGKDTVVKKAKWAKENVSGISLWELTQDSSDKEKSLFKAILDALK